MTRHGDQEGIHSIAKLRYSAKTIEMKKQILTLMCLIGQSLEMGNHISLLSRIRTSSSNCLLLYSILCSHDVVVRNVLHIFC